MMKKCDCGEYNLTEKCRKCGKETKDCHYKFLHLRDESEIHPEFKRLK